MKTDKIVEIFKTALLKHLHKVRYVENGYPIEAVPKSTILGLDVLVRKELDAIYTTEISEEEIYNELINVYPHQELFEKWASSHGIDIHETLIEWRRDKAKAITNLLKGE